MLTVGGLGATTVAVDVSVSLVQRQGGATTSLNCGHRWSPLDSAKRRWTLEIPVRVINLQQAEASLARLVEVIEKGQELEIIIERNGRPVAKLVPIDTAQRQNRIGVAKDKFVVADSVDVADAEVEELFLGKAQRP